LLLNLTTVAIAGIRGLVGKSFLPPRIIGQQCDGDPFTKSGLFAGLSLLINDILGRPGYSTTLQICVFTGTFTVALFCDWTRQGFPSWVVPSAKDHIVFLSHISTLFMIYRYRGNL
jgi:hypothetical protein